MFSKAGIPKNQQKRAVNDDDPFKALTEEIKRLRDQKPHLAPESSSNNSLNIDDGLVCTESLLTHDQIIDKITISDDSNNDDNFSGDSNEDDKVQVMKPKKTPLNGAIDTLLT